MKMQDIVETVKSRRQEILSYIKDSVSEREKLAGRQAELSDGIGAAERDMAKLDHVLEVLEPSNKVSIPQEMKDSAVFNPTAAAYRPKGES